MTTIEVAKDYLRKHAADGVSCPCCNQFVKVYRRALNSTMAYMLILLERNTHDWIHCQQFFHDLQESRSNFSTGDFVKLRYWGLIEKCEGKREDGSNRNGYCRITEEGIDFVHNKLQIRSHAMIYNNQCLRLDGDYVDIKDCLKKKFNYDELMADV